MIYVKDYTQKQNDNEEHNPVLNLENFKKYGNLLKKNKEAKKNLILF